ncbi:MAG: hypothetical protein ACKO85_15325, partial [Isosphaeraceae bacterium]
ISSMLAKIHNILMDEIRNHFDFNIEKFDEFNANAHFKGTGRQLFMEFRRYVAKKIWELRRRARMFEQIEPGIPLEITYSEADKKELLFYRNHLAQLEKQLKDSNSQLKSAGITESGRNKISHFFASNHEVNDTAPTTKAKPSEPPKKTQSESDTEPEQSKQEKPQQTNPCHGFVQKGILSKEITYSGYRPPVPDWLYRIQQERRRKRELQAAAKASNDLKIKVFTDLKQVISGPTEDTSPIDQLGQNKDLKELQTWVVPHEPVTLADVKPNPADLAHPTVKFYETAEDWADLLEGRKEIREKRVSLLKHLKHREAARYRKIREEKKKRLKKPEDDEKQKE